MDPIQPISPRTPGIASSGRQPVDRLERVSRDRDHPSRERPPAQHRPPSPPEDPEDDGGGEGRRIDVRA